MKNFRKAVIEAALNAEMSHHLRYAPGEDKPADIANHRNGTSDKTVLTITGRCASRFCAIAKAWLIRC